VENPGARRCGKLARSVLRDARRGGTAVLFARIAPWGAFGRNRVLGRVGRPDRLSGVLGRSVRGLAKRKTAGVPVREAECGSAGRKWLGCGMGLR